MKRIWLAVPCLAIVAFVGSGCAECVVATDCIAKKGPPPEGTKYYCGGECHLLDYRRDAGTDAGLACSPGCPSDQFCIADSSGMGVCKSCTADVGCTPGKSCVTAANNGLGVCVPGPATTSTQISTFLGASAGPLSPALPIEGAYVTYLKPAVGLDVAGFFLQAEPEGPAMFVTAMGDAGSPVQVGDRVSLLVAEKTVLTNGTRAASLVANLMVLSQHHPVQSLATSTPAGLAVDRSDAGPDELVTNLDRHESQLVYLEGDIASSAAGAGSGHNAFRITTPGVQLSTLAFRLRIPVDLVSNLDVALGCKFTLKAGPIWRAGTEAHPSVYDSSDLLLSQCPAPQLLLARPSSPNRVELLFDRQLRASSVEASDFMVPSLNVVNATASGYVVTVTTAGLQVPDAGYSVMVSNVAETTGTVIGSMNNAANFNGYAPPTVTSPGLVINEVNYDEPGRNMLEYIEIFNRSDAPADLNKYHLILVDGSASPPRGDYARFFLSNTRDASGARVTSLPPGGYLVAASATFFQKVPLPTGVLRLLLTGSGTNPDQDIIQNGPGDGIGILDNFSGTLVDSIVYEGSTTEGTMFTIDTAIGAKSLDFAEGTPTSTPARVDKAIGNDSLHRFPNGMDTANNNFDFVYLPKFTPGAPIP